MPRSRYASLYERLVANTIVPESQNSNGCWIWIRKLRKGYGRLNVWQDGRVRSRTAHRLMEGVFLRRPLRLDETLDHLCGCCACCNPDHWQGETNARNAQLRQHRWGNQRNGAISTTLPLTAAEDPLQRAADDAWEGIGSVLCAPTDPCPF